MNITTKTTTLAATVLAAGLVTATVAASAESSTQAPENGAQQIVERAVAYEGDPWEKRFREQFWKTQHIHDSWNRCHLGENVPKRLQRGTDCFPTLSSHTGR
jgi:hypothetical protein